MMHIHDPAFGATADDLSETAHDLPDEDWLPAAQVVWLTTAMLAAVALAALT